MTDDAFWIISHHIKHKAADILFGNNEALFIDDRSKNEIKTNHDVIKITTTMK